MGTDTYLLDRFRQLYPNSSITISQDYQFNLFSYAAAHPDKVLIQEIEDVRTIKNEIFIPALRRRDGGGILAENVLFGGYRVAFEDQEMVVYTASVGAASQCQEDWLTDRLSGPRALGTNASGTSSATRRRQRES